MKLFKLDMCANYFDGHGLLFFGFSCNGLFYWDIERNKTTMLGVFERDPAWCKEMNYESIERKGCFFFPPFKAKGIPYYDSITGKIDYCDMPGQLEPKILEYYGYKVRDKMLYMFPVNFLEPVLVIDMEQKKVKGIVDNWNKEFGINLQQESVPHMTGFLCQEEKIWMSFGGQPCVYELELDSWKVRLHYWKEISKPVVVKTTDEGFWIEDEGKTYIYRTDVFGNIKERYKLDEKLKNSGCIVRRIIKLKNGTRMIFLMKATANKIFVIDADQKFFELRLDRIIDDGNTVNVCYHYLEFEQEVWLLPHSQNDLIVINLCDYSLRSKKLPVPEGWGERSRNFFLQQAYEGRSMLKEGSGEEFSLLRFKDYLVSGNERNELNVAEKRYGQCVWQAAQNI